MSKEEILIALKEIHARYCMPASEQNYTDKDYACMQYEKLIIHLQKEIDRSNNIINELEKWIEEHKQYQLISERYIVWEDKLVNKLKALKENNKDVC